MPFTDTFANNILNWTFGRNALATRAAVYIGLCSNDPEADGGAITELSGNGYSRVLIAVSGAAYPNVIGMAADRKISNAYQINWTKATAAWDMARGFFLSTSPTVGETSSIYFYGTLTNPVTCAAGAVMLFDPETLQISFPETT